MALFQIFLGYKVDLIFSYSLHYKCTPTVAPEKQRKELNQGQVIPNIAPISFIISYTMNCQD